jgi:hypothetical protein
VHPSTDHVSLHGSQGFEKPGYFHRELLPEKEVAGSFPDDRRVLGLAVPEPQLLLGRLVSQGVPNASLEVGERLGSGGQPLDRPSACKDAADDLGDRVQPFYGLAAGESRDKDGEEALQPPNGDLILPTKRYGMLHNPLRSNGSATLTNELPELSKTWVESLKMATVDAPNL